MFLQKINPKNNVNPLLTLSSCWYNVKSKFPPTKYTEWIYNLLSIVNKFNLVIYTDKDSFSILKPIFINNPSISNKIGIKIKIIIKPMDEFFSYKYKDQWIQNHETSGLDLHQTVDWSLLMLWCEKPHFVNETITNKYFDTLFYGWCDIGYFRNENTATSILQMWPNSLKLLSLKNGIHYTCVENNKTNFVSLQQDILNHYKNKKDNDFLVINGQPTNKLLNNCFAGGFFIIRPNLIDTFVHIFDTKLRYYFDNNYTVKDDQTILLDVIFTNPCLFCLHWSNDKHNDNWFMFQQLLS
jgi:hypothetical protein